MLISQKQHGSIPIMLSHRELLIYVHILGVTPLQPCSVGYEFLVFYVNCILWLPTLSTTFSHDC